MDYPLTDKQIVMMRSTQSYNVGDTVTVPKEQAERLIASGAASFVADAPSYRDRMRLRRAGTPWSPAGGDKSADRRFAGAQVTKDSADPRPQAARKSANA